jgi:hypothetical protein
MPPVPPQGWGPPPAGMPPPAKKSNVGMIVGIVVGVVLLLCVGGGIGVFALLRNAANDVGDALSSVTVPVDTPPSSDGTDEPDPGPSGETFEMAVGEGVEVTEPDGDQWTVYVLAAEWFSEPCEEFGVADHPILVLDVEFEVVAGTASLNTLFDLSFVDDDGETAAPSILSFCDEPTLTDTLDRTEGDLVTGKVAFEVPEGKGGRLEYTTDFDPTASWLIPGQSG